MLKTRTRNHALSKAAASLCLVIGALASTAAWAQLPPTQTQNGVEYVSGGIGKEESDAFKAAQSQYPLALTFASQAQGSPAVAYAGNVQVVVRDEHDANVLNVTSPGPLFLARLSPGKYKVFATYEGETQSKQITIASEGSVDIRFLWKRPASGAD
ncbi:carboxypeptidase regulatory-like domain-containing protein [Pusillimonas sp. ANT_WB101]|uniref:carboxypeptidase regulatory-like domain-containing protein n=1 Tax=Pusillimonas sp. ANT_WB101 TaxID=2597356 RepID=UPI0011EDD99A|nr:carboxypeptidase regulatory-like domain-containing protein [Pusillimonas sp. ANT_WB101]KAA0910868.1 carboxypeptidase regulatory-like domain-containing protein [Pusillimonas sp. ANT_WB101]